MKISKNVIRALKNKDESAFETVYYAFNKLIYHIVYDMIHDASVTEELVSDIFVQMYQSIQMFDENNNFKYWLIQIAKNMAKNKISKLSREKYILSEEIVHQTKDTSNHNYDILLEDMKRYLDDEEIEIINMYILYGYSFKIIAEAFGRTTSSVSNQYYRALEKLKEVL
jgi:RNA polymerase sigma factor (sigma-70 family)